MIRADRTAGRHRRAARRDRAPRSDAVKPSAAAGRPRLPVALKTAKSRSAVVAALAASGS